MKYAVLATLAFSLLSGTAVLAAEGRDYNRDNRERPEERRDNRPAPRHIWQRGERLPAEFARGHEVFDWRARNLRAPPRGYHWVNVDGDFVLAALATGAIMDMALANAYANPNPYPPGPPDNYPDSDSGAYLPESGGGAPPPGAPYPPPQGAGAAPAWYYCNNPQGYYPYVTSCSQNWQTVAPMPPPPPGPPPR